MAVILLIETSTKSCSVAISSPFGTYKREENTANIHASSLTIFISEVMEMAKLKLHNIDAVAVSVGPGSYTGLRIGLSTAKGICYALNKPLIAIETLKAMASGFSKRRNIKNSEDLLCPMIDARRMEVYCALFSAEVNEIKQTEAKVLDESSFLDELKRNKVYFFGDGAFKIKDLIKSKNVIVVEDYINSAVDLIDIAQEKYLAKEFSDIVYIEPFYLKEFISGSKKTN